MEIRGAEVVCHILKNEGVEYVFGVPGNSEVPLLDALAETDIRYISAIHESVSMGMADGYARSSGKVGVALVHTTPGTANVIGNMLNAYDAGTPLVVLAGQQDSRLRWSDALLDSDLMPMVSQFTKGRWSVNRAQDIPRTLEYAFKEAACPPTGPVFVAVPRDVQAQAVEFNPSTMGRRQIEAAVRPDRELVIKVAQMLVSAQRPAILAGYQVPDADASGELAELAETIAAPVFTTGLVPKLIFPTDHPLYFGRVPPLGFGLPGLSEPADVLLAIGNGLFKQLFHIEGPLIPPATRLIQVDLDACGLSRECRADLALLGNPKQVLSELVSEARRITGKSERDRIRRRDKDLRKMRADARASEAAAFAKERLDIPMRPSRAVKDIADSLPADAVVVDEAVMLTSYVASIMDFTKPGSYYCSISCLGWGLPAALGVALGTSRRPVLALVGDGSALFGIQALWTANKYQLPVIVAVLNNRAYAAVKWGFAMYPDRRCPEGSDLGFELGIVDFLKLAGAFGIKAERIEDPEKLRPALKRAISRGQPALLDLVVDPRDVGYGLPSLPE
ncbi:MAG: thiamine pyrophosphate-binding protein [Dehalococcoidia bacterium]|nr:thiamine pyrophosphate-binding protein [Dehalococcoidia bacterium]